MPLFYSAKWQKELNFSDFMMLLEYLLGDLICVKLNQPQKNIVYSSINWRKTII